MSGDLEAKQRILLDAAEMLDQAAAVALGNGVKGLVRDARRLALATYGSVSTDSLARVTAGCDQASHYYDTAARELWAASKTLRETAERLGQ